MNTPVGFDQYLSFINCQLEPTDTTAPKHPEAPPQCAITLSRQAGCGAHVIAENVAQRMQARLPQSAPAWTVFDRNLMEKVLEEHHLPARLARLLPEDRISEVADIMDELFGVHPSAWKLVEQTADTILRLVQLGNVIIVGRGANVVTARLPHVFHARIVASSARRIENLQRFENLSRPAAADRIRHEDLGRERYLKKYFGKHPEDPSLYHLVLNTDRISFDDAAGVIADLAHQNAKVAARTAMEPRVSAGSAEWAGGPMLVQTPSEAEWMVSSTPRV